MTEIVDMIEQAGGYAEHIANREACDKRILEIAHPGNRIAFTVCAMIR